MQPKSLLQSVLELALAALLIAIACYFADCSLTLNAPRP